MVLESDDRSGLIVSLAGGSHRDRFGICGAAGRKGGKTDFAICYLLMRGRRRGVTGLAYACWS